MKLVLTLLLLIPLLAHAVDPKTTAGAALIMDADDGSVLYEKNDTDVRPIASITKLIGAMVIVDENLDLDEQITITAEDVKAAKPTGHSLPPGTTLTRKELLQLSLMNSHNRAAAALARTYPGGTDAFIQRVRVKLLELGMLDTVITEPTGLYNTNVSTATDLARLAVHAADRPLIRELSTAPSYSVDVRDRSRQFSTTNGLVRMDDWDVLVQKTGYIKDAGRCVVMITTIGAQRIVMVLLGSKSSKARRKDVTQLRNWVRDQLTSRVDHPHTSAYNHNNNNKGSP